MSGEFVREPCIKYDSKFEHSKLDKVELVQTWDDGTKTKKKCPVFTGDHGIEALLYVEDRFNSICRQLEIVDGEELFDDFAEVVSNQAENKWETLTGNLTAQQKTVDRFQQAIGDFYLSYCDDDSRDTMFAYLRKFKKPFSVAAGMHADRMEILIKYANKLPGMEPEMNDEQKKRVIFESFPLRWQHAYIQSGRRIQTESLIRVIQYMKDEKSFNDGMSNKRKRNDDDQQGNSSRYHRGRSTVRGGVRGGRGRGRNNTRSNPCRIHAGRHDWSECWDNEQSSNYRPNRHAGRGSRGRHQNWRGGRGFGRSNHFNTNGRGYFQNNYQNHNQGSVQQHQQRESYHNDPSGPPMSNINTAISTISADSQYHPARGAPSSVYAGDLHQYDLISNGNGSAWSTGNYHTGSQYGRRF